MGLYVSLFICVIHFSHLYIVVVLDGESGSITTRQVHDDVTTTPTKDLIVASMSTSSLVYVAGVVNASQYVPGSRLGYIVGAGDNTTDPDGNVFHNREVERDFQYFFRVFSADSTPEVRCCNISIVYVPLLC